nr:ATP-binding protein [uncultured Desulfobacter sp.]
MKNKKIVIVFLFIFMLVSVVMITHTRFKTEVKKQSREIRNTGRSLVKLVSLAYDRNLEKADKNYFFRELSYLVSEQDIAYLVIQDKQKPEPIISFFKEDVQEQIPQEIMLAALAGTGFQVQAFTTADAAGYLEFVKPVFKDGRPDVVVRLGMAQPSNRFFTLENFVLPLQVMVFILMALVSGYYWVFLLLKPFEKFISAAGPAPVPEKNQANVQAMVGELESFFTLIHDRLLTAERETHQLTAKVQVLDYENTQMFNIFNSLDFGVLMLDIRDTVFFINDYFLTLLGRDRQAILNQPVFDVLDQEELIAFIQQQNLMESGQNTTSLELAFPGGKPDQAFLVSFLSLTDPEGALFGRFIKVTDVSREKESERSRQEFINHIAHELRTPLTNIKAYNEMMMDGEISDLEMQKEFFNTINEETLRLDRLIQNILKLAETEINQLAVNKQMVKTDWLLESCMESIEAMSQEKNITIETRLPDNLPKISGDKEMLKAALINVLGNAVKYTPEFGRVTFSIRDNEGAVVFEIEDTGVGIDPRDLPHIFEKFYRSENDAVAEQTGSGLGLAIAAEIVKKHDGSIEVKSQLSQGSTFIVTLPKGNLQIG